MNVDFNKNNFCYKNNIARAQNSCNTKRFIAFKSQQDKFIRTSEISNTKMDEKSIERFFDKTYDEVIKQNIKANPILEKILFNKPKIEIMDMHDSDKLACYSLNNNKIEINSELFNEDFYVLGLKNPLGELEEAFNISSKKKLNFTLPRLSRKYSNLTTIKLSKEEKELYLQAILAHEIRHLIQGHLMLSTKNVGDATRDLYKTKKEKMEYCAKEYNKILNELDETEKQGKTPIEIGSEFDYVLNYKPKELLDENTSIKYSILPNDKRYFSIKDNFFKSEQKSINGFGKRENSTREEYLSSSLEVDAYNYEKEYFILQMGKYDDTHRYDVLNSIYIQLAKDSIEAEKAMEKIGMNFFEK